MKDVRFKIEGENKNIDFSWDGGPKMIDSHNKMQLGGENFPLKEPEILNLHTPLIDLIKCSGHSLE